MKGGEEVPVRNEEKSIINKEAEKTKSKTLVRNAKTRWEPSNLLAGPRTVQVCFASPSTLCHRFIQTVTWTTYQPCINLNLECTSE